MLSLDQPINSILSEDLRTLAVSLGVSEQIESGNATCEFCGRTVDDYRQVFALFPRGSDLVQFVGRDAECIRKFSLFAQREGVL